MRSIVALCRSEGSWGIHAVTTDGVGVPTARKVSTGNPSLLRLVPDWLNHWSATNGAADAIASSRTLDETLASLAAGPEHAAVGNLDVQIACPVGGSRPEMWAWLQRAADGDLRFPGAHTLFVYKALPREIAGIFNAPGLVTDGPIRQSARLDAIAKGEELIEMWLMPAWRAKALLPAAFPDRTPPPPRFRPQPTPKERYHDYLRQQTAEKRKASAERSQREHDQHMAKWNAQRRAQMQAETRARAREEAVRKRVEEEMFGR